MVIYSQENIQKILHNAYIEFINNDKDLLDVDANERSLTHRIAVYLERKFEWYSVDCEYSKNGNHTKVLSSYNWNKTGVVLPDIIVHERRTSNNLLVIEWKKNEEWNDRNKLKAYKMDLWYQFAVLLKFPRNPEMSKLNEYIIFI